MNLLLDTHVFLWLRHAPEKISKTVLEAYFDTGNTVYLSMVSIWEMQIKLQLGKLELGLPLSRLIEQQCTENALRLLPIEAAHVFALNDLPMHRGFN